jgi:hypothetical protein
MPPPFTTARTYSLLSAGVLYCSPIGLDRVFQGFIQLSILRFYIVCVVNVLKQSANRASNGLEIQVSSPLTARKGKTGTCIQVFLEDFEYSNKVRALDGLQKEVGLLS